MRSGVIVLLTIAALLLAFVLSMGMFFALIRPKTAATTYVYEYMGDDLLLDPNERKPDEPSTGSIHAEPSISHQFKSGHVQPLSAVARPSLLAPFGIATVKPSTRKPIIRPMTGDYDPSSSTLKVFDRQPVTTSKATIGSIVDVTRTTTDQLQPVPPRVAPAKPVPSFKWLTTKPTAPPLTTTSSTTETTDKHTATASRHSKTPDAQLQAIDENIDAINIASIQRGVSDRRLAPSKDSRRQQEIIMPKTAVPPRFRTPKTDMKLTTVSPVEDATTTPSTSKPKLIVLNKMLKTVENTKAPPPSAQQKDPTVETVQITGNDLSGKTKDMAQEEKGDSGLVEEHWKTMAEYGKVVGLTYHKGQLFVPSHNTGAITILTTPNLDFVDEIPCQRCRIYDIVVLEDGSIIVAQGKAQKLTKIDRKTKSIVKEVELDYDTLGMAVSVENSVFVLSRSHDAVYRYDSDLNELGVIKFKNTNSDDCNFLDIARDAYEIYLSCQNGIRMIDYEGEDLYKVEPANDQVSYSVGIGQDTFGNILAVRRGQAQIDVFDIDGMLLRTLGRKGEPTLWSDLAVAGGYAYVVDYLSATVKALKLTY